MSDQSAKTSGFGIGELGKVPENDPVSAAIEAEQRDQQQKALNSKKLYCHYCGMPAKSFGFFGEPACEDCGG